MPTPSTSGSQDAFQRIYVRSHLLSRIEQPAERKPKKLVHLLNETRQAWQITDQFLVTDYSFGMDWLNIYLGSLALDVFATQYEVLWRLSTDTLRSESSVNAISIVVVENSPEERVFNRNMVLDGIIGKRIRYSSSDINTHLYWERDLEIAFSPYQIINSSYSPFLYYERCDYRKIDQATTVPC